jgi:hypothetical protein
MLHSTYNAEIGATKDAVADHGDHLRLLVKSGLTVLRWLLLLVCVATALYVACGDGPLW